MERKVVSERRTDSDFGIKSEISKEQNWKNYRNTLTEITGGDLNWMKTEWVTEASTMPS
jgi:hypothetical protein